METLQPNAELEAVTPWTPFLLFFSLISAYSFPIKNESQSPHSKQVGWFEKTPLNLVCLVWRGARNSLHTVWKCHFLEVVPCLCFAKAFLGLFCYLVFFSMPLFPVMMHGACQKIQQHGLGSREKMTTGSSHGSRFGIVFCFIFRRMEQSPTLTI